MSRPWGQVEMGFGQSRHTVPAAAIGSLELGPPSCPTRATNPSPDLVWGNVDDGSKPTSATSLPRGRRLPQGIKKTATLLEPALSKNEALQSIPSSENAVSPAVDRRATATQCDVGMPPDASRRWRRQPSLAWPHCQVHRSHTLVAISYQWVSTRLLAAANG